MTHTTNDAPVTVEQCDIDMAERYGEWLDGLSDRQTLAFTDGKIDELPRLFARHRLAALASAPVGDGDTSRGKVNLSALHHAERLLGADNAVEKIMTQSDEQLVADAMKVMSAQAVKVAIRGWLDADDASHWGAFETALDAAINDTPERAMIVAMLRADAETMRTNATAYSEESPTDARALHEVATTLGFKAAQIERGDHLGAEPASAPAGDVVDDRDALAERLCAARFPTTVARHPDYYRVQLTEESRERWRVVADAALARPRAAVGEREYAEAIRVALLQEDGDAWMDETDTVDAFRIDGTVNLVDVARILALQSPPAKE